MIVGDVAVGGPVVLPAFAVEEVAEPIGVADGQVDGEREAAVRFRVHDDEASVGELAD